MMRYCAQTPGSVGFVISQDGDVRAITLVKGRLVMWESIGIHNYFSRTIRRHSKTAKT
jgi:hypothetical protein